MQLVIVNTKWEAPITPSIIILRGKVPTTRVQGILCTLSMRWLMTMNFGCAFFTGLVAFNNPLVMQFTLCGACLCDAWLFFTLLPHYITLKYTVSDMKPVYHLSVTKTTYTIRILWRLGIFHLFIRWRIVTFPDMKPTWILPAMETRAPALLSGRILGCHGEAQIEPHFHSERFFFFI